MTLGTQIDHETINMSLRKRKIVTTRLAGLAARQKIAQGEFEDDMNDQLAHENQDLLEANLKLKEQLEESNDLVAFWANDSESFRRTLHHLRDNWVPKSGAEADLSKIVSEQHASVRDNPEWQKERQAISDKQKEKRKETKTRSRPRPG